MTKSNRIVLSLLIFAAAFGLSLASNASAAPSTQWKQCGSVRDGKSFLSAEAMNSPCAPALQIARAFTGNFLSHCGLDENYHEVCHFSGFACPIKKASGGGIICTKEEARVRIKGVTKD